MPFLPLDYPEPFAATFGVMLNPGEDELSRKCANSAAATITSNAIRLAVLAGHNPCRRTLLETHKLGIDSFPEASEHHRQGLLAGHLFVAYFALYNSDPKLASWNHAIEILSDRSVHQGTAFSRRVYHGIKMNYATVLHLWGAWVLRGRTLTSHGEFNFEAYDDFQFFLFESECLRQWGQTWKPSRKGAESPLIGDVWRPPQCWVPPRWGLLSHPEYPKEVLASLHLAGRPRESA
jgi:hypothetical protein